jgi:ribosomal protein S18
MSLPRIQNKKNNNQDQSMNTMVGDISAEEMSKIPGISSIAEKAKHYALQSPIFRKKSPGRKTHDKHKEIHFSNVSLIRGLLTESGKITPNRVVSYSIDSQRLIRKSIKRARILALIGFKE